MHSPRHLHRLGQLIGLLALFATPQFADAGVSRVASVSVPAAVLSPQATSANSAQAAAWLRKLTGYLRSLGSYTVRFTIESNENSIDGSYTVAGDNYYLQLADAEVYGVLGTRYEVDNRRREVAIDRTNLDSHNILDNPTRAFDFVDSEFTPQQAREEENQVIVTLLPQASQSISAITLTLDAPTGAPKLIEYDFDGERIRIAILHVGHTSAPPKSYNAASYDGYEIIDFR